MCSSDLRQWRFPPSFGDAIARFPEPLVGPLDRTAGVLHLAVWRARAEANKLTPDEMASTIPAEVCKALGLNPTEFLQDMPPLSELCAGMEEMLG